LPVSSVLLGSTLARILGKSSDIVLAGDTVRAEPNAMLGTDLTRTKDEFLQQVRRRGGRRREHGLGSWPKWAKDGIAPEMRQKLNSLERLLRLLQSGYQK
jgi:hypothetical protein